MAANLAIHAPIAAVQNTNNTGPLTLSIPEQAGQTFPIGVPVQLNAGFVRKWDGATIAAGILGFSLQNAANLATNGAGSPGFYGQVGPPGAIQTYGTVPNQPLAFNIAEGSPMTDGRTLLDSATASSIFEGQFDNSVGAVAADYTPTNAMIGTQVGLTFDANGQAYWDGGKVTPGTNTVGTIVSINPVDQVQAGTPNTYIVNARVRVQVLASARQLY